MGEKGTKRTSVAAVLAQEVCDELASLGASSKGMFGGYGVFSDGVMFGLIDSNAGLFLRGGDEPTMEGSHRHGRMPYWSVPRSVAADERLMLEEASAALALARSAKK